MKSKTSKKMTTKIKNLTSFTYTIRTEDKREKTLKFGEEYECLKGDYITHRKFELIDTRFKKLKQD